MRTLEIVLYILLAPMALIFALGAVVVYFSPAGMAVMAYNEGHFMVSFFYAAMQSFVVAMSIIVSGEL